MVRPLRRLASRARVLTCAIVALLALAQRPALAADPVADFYTGKTIQIMIGFSAGGGYDIYARTLARYLGRHIPGEPAIIPVNMTGAGSLKAVNYLYNIAPKDGATLATFAPGVIVEPLLGHPEGAQFQAEKFTWIGSPSNEVSVCAFRSGAGISSWHDMETKPFTIGGSAAGAESDIFPTVLRNLFHLPLKLVTGFPGAPEMVLAMQRGEIDGRCGWSWTSLLSRDKALYDTGQIRLTLEIGLKKLPALSDIPLVMELSDDPKIQAALKLILSRQAMARPFAAPPGVPATRALALRTAFDATMKDPDFLAEAQKLSLEVSPVTGAEIEAMIKENYAASPDVISLAAAAMKETPFP